VTAAELVQRVLCELDAVLEPQTVGTFPRVLIGSSEWREGVRSARQLVELAAQEAGVIE